MSVQAHAWAKTVRTGSPTLKAVLVAIADYADATGRAWPSQEQLAIDTEFSLRAVRNAVAGLEAMGLLIREVRRRRDGSRQSDVLTLDLAGSNTRQEVPPDQPAPGSNQPARRSKQPATDAEQAARSAGLTTFEPSENHQGNRQANLTGDAHLAAGPSPAVEQRDEQAEARAARRREVDRAVRALCAITGRSDHSARAAIAAWLSQTNDELTIVAALIEEADRREVVDPTMWIQAQLRLRKEQLAGTLGPRHPAFEQAPTGQAARLIQLSAKLQGDSDAAGRGPGDDDLLIVDGEPEGSRGEDRGVPWAAGGGARPSEQLLGIARHGTYDPGAAAALRRGRAAGGRS